jgi:hypothetical protein
MSKLSPDQIQAVHARAEMVNGQFDLTADHKLVMNKIREAAAQFSNTLKQLALQSTVEIDPERWLKAMNSVQKTKNVACDAVILPLAPKFGASEHNPSN